MGGHLGGMAGSAPPIKDLFGNVARISPVGDQNVQQPFRLVGQLFGSVAQGLDKAFWVPSTSGTGATSSILFNSVCTLASTTAGAGYAQLTSVRTARLIYGYPHRLHQNVRVPVLAVAGSLRRWGAYTIGIAPAPTDGYFWSVNASGVPSVNAAKAGVITSVASGLFNGQVAAYALDINQHLFDIVYTHEKALFYIDDLLVHSMIPTTAPLIDTPYLPISAMCSGTGTQATLELWALSNLRQGRDISAPAWVNIHGINAGNQLKIGPGTLHKVVYNNGSASSLVSVYDSMGAATNPIALIGPINSGPYSLTYNLDFYTGLYVTQTIATTDVMFIFE